MFERAATVTTAGPDSTSKLTGSPELAAARKLGSTLCRVMPIFFSMTTVAEVSEFAGRLAELLKQVQAGDEVLLTQGNKPVAKLVPTPEQQTGSGAPLRIRSLKGHRVLTPVIPHAELAGEMFRKQN